MRINSNFLLSLLLFNFCLSACAQKKKVTLTLQFQQPYCGGARPTPEILAEAEKPKPLTGYAVIFISSKGKADSARTNSKGIITKKLPPGEYQLYEGWRYYRSSPNGEQLSEFDKDCLEQEWKRSFMQIRISKSGSSFIYNDTLNMPCPHQVPCLSHRNPPPMRE